MEYKYVNLFGYYLYPEDQLTRETRDVDSENMSLNGFSISWSKEESLALRVNVVELLPREFTFSDRAGINKQKSLM